MSNEAVSSNAPSPEASAELRARGYRWGLSAYLLWGLLPIFWKQLSAVPSLEIIAHRVVWSALFLMGILAFRGELPSVLKDLRSWRVLRIYAVTGALITVNWLVFVYAVAAGRVVECSLGYFLVPLVNVLLGVAVLKERLRRSQTVAVSLAAVGVGVQLFAYGQLPWVALLLALTFALYGLIRKVASRGALAGATLETLIVSPAALCYLLYLQQTQGLVFGAEPKVTVLLIGCGMITAVPLMLFAAAVRVLPLSVIGFLQYLAPTLQLLLGIFAFGEPFDSIKLFSFALIWTALVVFAVGGRFKVAAPSISSR